MNYRITYKHIRNGYVRINPDWSLQITIPTRLKHDEKFKNDLIAKGEILLKRYSKRTHIQTHGDDFVMLFGELVPKDELPSYKNLKTYLKETLEEYSRPLLDKYSEIIDHKYHKLIIRITHSKRWSCTSDQHISLNLNLVHLPTQFIRYVIIHEVCHLKHKNHGTRFRELVEKLYPNHKQIRKELRNFVLK